MNPSELIAFLNRIGAKPKKGLSQNFLISPQVVEEIIKTAEVTAQDTVLEIGPGPGALTAALLKKGAKVYAVEMDSLFAAELERFQNGNLSVFEADFLKFPLGQLPANSKVVANLPYHITTPILEKLFSQSFSSITIMVQEEVADRMKADAGSKTFGSLSLFVQFYTKIHSSFKVPASCFYPKPNVDSTVIRLDSRPWPEVDPVLFFDLVHKAFQQRRKMISSSLKEYPKQKIKEALLAIHANPDARPEDLSLDLWVLFVNRLKSTKTS
jgi:16S rRNA (adenine1518-N6/adenine1519-N6)-dimethyltransferase